MTEIERLRREVDELREEVHKLSEGQTPFYYPPYIDLPRDEHGWPHIAWPPAPPVTCQPWPHLRPTAADVPRIG